MRFCIEQDKLCLELGDGSIIRDISAYVEYAGEHYDTIIKRNGKWKVEKRGGSFEASDGVFSVRAVPYENGALIGGSFSVKENIGALVNFCFFKGQFEDTVFDKAFINAGTYFNGVKTDDMSSDVSVEALTLNQCKESTDYAVGINGKKCIAAGGVSYRKEFSSVKICANGSIALNVPMFFQPKEAGETVVSDDFAIITAKSVHEALELYSDAVTKYNGGQPKKPVRAYSGWCSWYYYGPGISEQIILNNMNELKKRGVDIDIIQIDDGWNINRGDWEANEKFPSGMKKLADEIKKEGYIPGIWISPLTAQSDSELFRSNPDIFVKSYDSDEIYGSNTIDFSTEKAQKYLYDLFHKISYNWGYRYIKFDFVIYGISAGRYADSRFNGVKNYRKALEIMRSAVTEDTLLLACTSPLSQSLNHVDMIRTSMDIFEQWNSLKKVAKQVFLRGFFNKHVRIDPDCLMLRTAENEDGEAFRLCTRTKEEIKTFASFIAATGGNTMLSDKVTLLSEEQTEMFKKILPLNQIAGRAFDLGVRDIPSEILVDGGDISTLLLFNWEDYPQKLGADLGKEMHVFDFWESKVLGKRKKLSFLVPPHECKVLHCSDKTVRGCFDRIVPNLIADAGDNMLRICGLKKGERILLDLHGKIESVCGGQITDGVLTAENAEATVYYK